VTDEAGAVDWRRWESLILERGVVIDRPRGSSHPRYPEMVYPLDYGYIPGTIGGDGAEVDVFVGTASTGLCAALVTRDAVKADTEIKLLWNLRREEVEAVRRFLNDGGMSATIVWRDVDPG
jgi:inorganic pyrophosphatase